MKIKLIMVMLMLATGISYAGQKLQDVVFTNNVKVVGITDDGVIIDCDYAGRGYHYLLVGHPSKIKLYDNTGWIIFSGTSGVYTFGKKRYVVMKFVKFYTPPKPPTKGTIKY